MERNLQWLSMIISKTRMGMSNSAAATALAIERYKPIAIINQGTAGGTILISMFMILF